MGCYECDGNGFDYRLTDSDGGKNYCGEETREPSYYIEILTDTFIGMGFYFYHLCIWCDGKGK